MHLARHARPGCDVSLTTSPRVGQARKQWDVWRGPALRSCIALRCRRACRIASSLSDAEVACPQPEALPTVLNEAVHLIEERRWRLDADAGRSGD